MYVLLGRVKSVIRLVSFGVKEKLDWELDFFYKERIQLLLDEVRKYHRKAG